jgi:hypothetical protein
LYIRPTCTKMRKTTINFAMSVLSLFVEQLCSHCTDTLQISHYSVFRRSVNKIQISLKPHNNNGTLHEDTCTFMVTSRRILLKIRNVSGKFCRENQVTHFTFNIFMKSVPTMRQLGKSFVQPEEQQMITSNNTQNVIQTTVATLH